MAGIKRSDIKQVSAYEYNGKRYKTLESLAEHLAMQSGQDYYKNKLPLTLEKYVDWNTADKIEEELTQIRAKIVVYKKRAKPIILKKLKEWFADENRQSIT